MRHLQGITTRILIVLCMIVQLAVLVEARKKKEEPVQEEEAVPNTFLVLPLVGIELGPKTVVVHALIYIISALVAVHLLTQSLEAEAKAVGNRPKTSNTLDVVLCGCGLPKKGMGWYHLTQLLEMPRVNVRAVVEPFFLNPKLCPSPPASFAKLRKSLEKSGVKCARTVDDLTKFTKPTMCLIAGRTPDNPSIFCQCINKGAKVIYLEKPGAPSVEALEEMEELAAKAGVKVYLGYNKNVTPYVHKTLELARKTKNSHVVFCHNNSYKESELPECFSRSSEGMLKNMAIHELALLVSFFDVTADTIAKFEIDKNKKFSEKLTVWKPGTDEPDPEYITDFLRIKFTIKTKWGTSVSIMADRCGGNVSWGAVNNNWGREVEKFAFPDQETQAKLEKQVENDPEMMPYFFIQSDDYQVLKDRVVDATLDGKDAEGIATIRVGVEALKLAEYATEELNKTLKSK